MSKAIRFHETGGPEVLRFEDVVAGKPAPDEAQVRHTAIGVNFIDVYDRTGDPDALAAAVHVRELIG